ncbi:unnamed protein product [Paramecium primaurelia]|uniref:VLIG-type G domain-containing protein n=1 Tax=Paramecium primaurelia TaxID=5886 RepID=A0A8S1LY05_PARPR|nr:unnamed protein product [Paramecium primaurelia]
MTQSLSKYQKTLELQSIVNDKLNQIISSDNAFQNIVECFFVGLKKENDKQIAIKWLIQMIPNNNYLIQQKQNLDERVQHLRNRRLQSGDESEQNKKICQQYEKLYYVKYTKNLEGLKEYLRQDEFFNICRFPISLNSQNSVFVKLNHYGFKIIDLIIYCRNPSFQLNSITLKNLIFFFFIPEELQIEEKEKIGLFQILGEILCNSWIQFEYHYQKLQQQNQDQTQLQKQLDILKLLQQDSSKLYHSIQQIIKQLLNKNDSSTLHFTDIENLIDKLLPINFDLQIIFYMMCFYCLINFDQYYNQKLAKNNKDEKFQLLNLYLQFRRDSTRQIDGELMIKLEQYQEKQSSKEEKLQKLKQLSFYDLLEKIFEENLYTLNKKQHIVNLNLLNQKNAKLLNILTNIRDEKQREVAQLLRTLIQENNLNQIILKINQERQKYLSEELEIILQIVIVYLDRSGINFQLLKSALQQGRSENEKKDIINVSEFESLPFLQQINLLAQFSDDQLKLVPNQDQIANNLIQKYLNNETQNYIEVLQIIRRLFQQNQALKQFNQLTKLFSQLFHLNNNQIYQLIQENRLNQVSQQIYINTISILHYLFSKLKAVNEKQDFKDSIRNILRFPQIYCFNNFLELFLDIQLNLEQIKNVFNLVYYWQTEQNQQLQNSAEIFYMQDAVLYRNTFESINYFNNNQLEPTIFEQKLRSDIYPRNLNIQLEEFNISMTLLDKKQQQNLVKEWIQDVKDSNNFKKLIPFFFNIIKRGESSKTFLSIINQQIKYNKELSIKYGYFNQKSIFQIFYNNANDELKVMLLKLMSKQYPIPLLYRTPYNAETGELEKLTFNINTFYVFQENFPIINLSLNEKQKKIGKTKLINKIFYQQDKFEIQDSNQLNNQTIDIMYDFEFQGSRNLSVADAHNFIPFTILDDILPMFKLWIIQLDTEKEIEMTIQNLQKLQSFQIKEKVVCFLIRNSSSQDLNENQKELLYSLNIKYKKIIDLSDKDLNKQMEDDEIEQVSQFLYDIINQNSKVYTVNQEQYFKFICQMKCQNLEQTNEIKLSQKLFSDIEKELEKQMKHEQGFYNKNAFPLRSIDYQIKQEKDEYIRIEQSKDDQTKQQKLQRINQNIKVLQSQMKSQQPTKIISKFCSLLKKPNYYILYLHFVDIIRKFNEKNTYELQGQNQKLNEEIQELKKERDELKSKDKNKEITIKQIQQRDEIQKLIDEKVLQLKQNSKIISKRNIGIELFWREIISQKDQCIKSQIDIDPAKIIKEMISKGEPYEFLDGDQLRIDQQFLIKLISNFKDQGQERILVLSVLGPQSSGKSTILNKIFGCHFWTSVGRCTKGIYLQLLKIHNKAFFNNLFDYIIILDTEGLQSPNQDDQEFDKKIALFVLSISDIILVNVKGDITKEFRSLVEMCIYTLGQMKSFTSSKQITWCFNQNNDVNNYAPFLAQLQSIVTSLSTEFSNQKEEDEVIDYTEILGITQANIKILGFASTEKLWRQNESDGIYADWRQLIINGTFSEEAYEYGIRVIKAYVDKFGRGDDQGRQMENLQYFIQKIETTWQSISSLPDLIEFSQLIYHQQNQFMRQQFNEIMNNYVFPKQNDFIQNIQESIQQNNLKLSLEALTEIEKQQINYMNGQFDQIRKEFIEKLTTIKNEKKISKKVFTRYVNMVKDRIKSEIAACQLIIYNEIKTQETNLQKKKGLLKKEEELQKYKKNENKIKMKFNEIWEKILNEHIKQQEEMFKECCDKQLEVIQQEFQKYILKTNNEPFYKQKYHQKLIKKAPEKGDFLTSLEIFNPELQTQQFMVVEKTNKNYQYYENFCQSISKKIAKLNDKYVLQINNFYSYKIELKWITKNSFNNYIKTDLNQDIKQYYNIEKKQGKQAIKQFLEQFTIFGYQIDEKYIDQIFNNLNSWYGTDISQQLIKCFQPNQRLYYNDTQYEISINFINQHCKGLAKIVQKKNYTIYIFDNLNNLIKTYNQDDNFLLEKKQDIIVNENFQSYNIFHYIQNQKDNYQHQNQIKNNIAKVVQDLMNENNNEGWNKMYGEIHQMILDEIIDINKNAIIQENENVKVNKYSFSQIKRIMQKIEVQIKEFNMQFSDFGVILNDLGERCLFYYAIFTVWRILCFGLYQSIESNIKELKDQTDEQYIKFKADIQQNKKEQSKIRGQTQAQDIINQATQRCYQQYCKEAEQIIAIQSKESSFDLMKKLDKEILERSDKNITDEQIISYIRNQCAYIGKYVKDKITNIKSEIQIKLTNKLRQDLKSHLQKVDANTKNLHDFVTYDLKAQDYFKQLNNPDEAPELLYKIVQSCLQGQVQQNLLDQIKEDKRDAFQTQDFHIFDFPLCMPIQKSDAEIQILLDFVKAFEKKIKDSISSLDTMQIEFEKLKVQADLDALQLKQIGCLEFCPICKRKCDQEIDDNNHQHQCRNGHQLRGMSGVLIGCHPSLYTCEEIQDDFFISELETQNIKKWKEIKQIYNTWLFSCLTKDELNLQKEKFMKIWNNNIGQMICKKLTEEIGKDIFYVPKQEVELGANSGNQKTAHYILMLDDSGSMYGRPFESAKQGLVAFLFEIQKNPNSRVTIIIFNSSARCAVDYQIPNAQAQQSQIIYQGGGTNFNAAFLLACEKISQNKEFDKFDSHSIFFYTDGGDGYPRQALEKFKQITPEKKQKIELIACSEEQSPITLIKVVEFFKSNFGFAKLQASMQPQQIASVWIEEVSKLTHQIKNC